MKKILLCLLFAINCFGVDTTNTYVATANSRANIAANWDAVKVPTVNHNCVIPAANTYACSLGTHLSVKSWDIQTGNTGKVYSLGWNLTCVDSLNINDAVAHNFGTNSPIFKITGDNGVWRHNNSSAITTGIKIQFSGKNDSLKLGCQFTNCMLLTIDANASLSITNATYGLGLRYSSGNKLVMGNNARLTLSNNHLDFYIEGNETLWSLGTNDTINGTPANITVKTSVDATVTIPAITYTGTGTIWTFKDNGGAITSNFTGNMDLGHNKFTLSTQTYKNTFNLNGKNLTCGWLQHYIYAAGVLKTSCGGNRITVDSFVSTIIGKDTILADSSTWVSSGPFLLTSVVWNKNKDTIILNGGDYTRFTTGNNSLNTIIFRKTPAVVCSLNTDTLKCVNLIYDSGTVKINNGKPTVVSNLIQIGAGQTLTLSSVTMTDTAVTDTIKSGTVGTRGILSIPANTAIPKAYIKDIVSVNKIYDTTTTSLNGGNDSLIVFKYAAGVYAQSPTTVTVTSASPATGINTGGTIDTLTGTGFYPPCSVSVGGSAYVSATYIDTTHIRYTTPAGSTGLMSVTVKNGDGKTGSRNVFTYTSDYSGITAVRENIIRYNQPYVDTMPGYYSLSKFDSGYSSSAGAGVEWVQTDGSLDSSRVHPYYGAKSLRLGVTSATGGMYLVKTYPSPIDLSSYKTIRFCYYADHPRRISGGTMRFRKDASNYYQISWYLASTLYSGGDSSGIFNISMNQRMFAKTGTVNWNAISSIRITFYTETADSNYVYFNKLWATVDTATKAVVTFTFDDQYVYTKQYGLPILDTFGYKALFLVRGATVRRGAVSQSCLTWNQIDTMQTNGYAFGSHTYNHPSMDTCSVGEKIFEIKRNDDSLRAHNITSRALFAYPYTKSTYGTDTLLRKYFDFSRGGYFRLLDTCNGIPVSNIFKTLTYPLDATFTVTDLKKFIDYAVTTKQLISIFGHAIVDSTTIDGSAGLTFGTAQWDSLVRYCAHYDSLGTLSVKSPHQYLTNVNCRNYYWRYTVTNADSTSVYLSDSNSAGRTIIDSTGMQPSGRIFTLTSNHRSKQYNKHYYRIRSVPKTGSADSSSLYPVTYTYIYSKSHDSTGSTYTLHDSLAADADSMKIYKYDSSGGTWTLVDSTARLAAGATFTLTKTSLSPLTKYYFKLRGKNSSGTVDSTYTTDSISTSISSTIRPRSLGNRFDFGFGIR